MHPRYFVEDLLDMERFREICSVPFPQKQIRVLGLKAVLENFKPQIRRCLLSVICEYV